MKRHIQLGKQQNALEKGMTMWCEWHKFMDALCIPRFRLEDIDPHSHDIIQSLFRLLGRTPPSDGKIKSALEQLRTKTNSRKHRPTVSWTELLMVDPALAREGYGLALTYGYDDKVDLEELEAAIDPKARKSMPTCAKRHPFAGGKTSNSASAGLPLRFSG